ncbi:hypothetical protein ACHAXS_005803 [Conticribra weissflogii]
MTHKICANLIFQNGTRNSSDCSPKNVVFSRVMEGLCTSCSPLVSFPAGTSLLDSSFSCILSLCFFFTENLLSEL